MYALENTEGVPGTADGGASRNVIDTTAQTVGKEEIGDSRGLQGWLAKISDFAMPRANGLNGPPELCATTHRAPGVRRSAHKSDFIQKH